MRKATIPTIEGNDEIETYTLCDFPYDKLHTIALKCKHRKGMEILTDFATFDIETTTIEVAGVYTGFMYHWQMCVNGIVCAGRTWEEWQVFMDRLSKIYKTNESRKFVIYVHNLAYEYQFIKDFLQTDTKVFAVKSRKPLYVTTPNGIEYRCSYLLSNMSLAKACANEKGCYHQKAVGDLDYRIIRTPTTDLTDEEYGYCVADVVCLYDFIKARLRNENDNLESIPMTSTGYVRRDCRRYCRADRRYRQKFLKLTLSVEDYTMLKEAGRGGNTHANRFLSGKILHNVDSYDVASSYPFQLIARKFPMTKFVQYGEVESIAELNRLIEKEACLFRVLIEDVSCKESLVMPYIPYSKCLSVGRYTLDNGRILTASHLLLTVTDIDWKLIEQQYDFDHAKIRISDMRIAEYGYLPEPIRKCVLDYFHRKSELKVQIEAAERAGDFDKAEELSYLYAKMKARLNAIFGMMYTDICHDIIEVEGGSWLPVQKPDIAESIKKFYKSRNSFLFYAWGVWCTAHARQHLQTLIDEGTGYGTIYCDTDSSKAVGVDHERITALNAEIMRDCDALGAFADVDGKRVYMGVYEHENDEPIEAFKTLGAKKYCYIDKKGLHITISGVSKAKNPDSGIPTAVEEMRSIENFIPGFTFSKSAGLELYYNDEEGIHTIHVNGEEITTASNIGMKERTYTIGITDEYSRLIGFDFFQNL